MVSAPVTPLPVMRTHDWSGQPKPVDRRHARRGLARAAGLTLSEWHANACGNKEGSGHRRCIIFADQEEAIWQLQREPAEQVLRRSWVMRLAIQRLNK